jgi:hypothetical protein
MTQKVGLGSKVYAAPNTWGPLSGVNVTMLGAFTWPLNIIGKKFGWWRQGGSIDLFLRGVNSESFNLPMVENVKRVNTGGRMAGGASSAMAGAPIGVASGTGPAMSMGNRAGSAVNYTYVPAFAYD